MPELDPLVHQQTRLRILAALHRNHHASFTDLRDGLDLTPGNLQSHADRLAQAGYIRVSRVLVDLSFQLRYHITEAGRQAFLRYQAELAELLGLEPASTAAAGPVAPTGRDKARTPASER